MDNIIYNGDCLSVLGGTGTATVDLVCTDPPFNIGFPYDVYDDRKGYTEYISWCKSWLSECRRVLKDDGSIIVCIGDEYAAEMNILLKEQGFYFRNWIIWNYSFGQSQRKKFARSHTHIHWFTKHKTDFCFNADAVRVPSSRQLKYKDKRAHPLGKVPDDVYTTPACTTKLASQLLDGGSLSVQADSSIGSTAKEENSPSITDVWNISRLCGSFNERIKKEDGSAHPCQMPEGLLERLIKGVSDADDLIVDPFGGTGTTSAVAYRLGRRFITCDMSESYCKVIAQRIFGDADRWVKQAR